MKQFVHTIKDPLGTHALVITKLARKFAGTLIQISSNGREVDADALIKLICLNAREGSKVRITAEGSDEDAAIIAMSNFFQNNL